MISKAVKSKIFWFQFRRCIFQVILPILLILLSFFDFAKQSADANAGAKIYSHLYFYTSGILLFYTCIKYVLEYIFCVCSVEITCKKNVTSSSFGKQKFHISEQKKIYKIKYSGWKIFVLIDKICVWLGIVSPLLLPLPMILTLGNINEIDDDDEDCTLFSKVITNLSLYDSTIYDTSNIIEECRKKMDSPLEYALIPKSELSSSDQEIYNYQQELFGTNNGA